MYMRLGLCLIWENRVFWGFYVLRGEGSSDMNWLYSKGLWDVLVELGWLKWEELACCKVGS